MFLAKCHKTPFIQILFMNMSTSRTQNICQRIFSNFSDKLVFEAGDNVEQLCEITFTLLCGDSDDRDVSILLPTRTNFLFLLLFLKFNETFSFWTRGADFEGGVGSCSTERFLFRFLSFALAP